MLVVNGWQIFAHPLLLDQIERLTAAVARAKTKDLQGFQKSANAKLLAALRKLMLETIPSDPTRPEYRQGGTLGANRKHWFRAKFGGQRFRLFFRYDSAAKIILFAWVNDTDTLRTYGSKTDAYAVFRSMLDKDAPPDDWRSLVKESASPEAAQRLDNIGKTPPYRSK
jgi:toxin YhaV